MNECKHMYGYDESNEALIFSYLEIEEEKKFSPLYIIEFNFCPLCGIKLDKSSKENT